MKRILRYFAFPEIKFGSIIYILGLIPVFFALLIVELYIDITYYETNLISYEISESVFDMRYLIYYLTVSFTHILLCLLIIWQLNQAIKRDVSSLKLTPIKAAIMVILIITFILLYFLDSINLDIGYLSHERIYSILSESNYYSSYFETFPNNILNKNVGVDLFYTFSILPFSLICIALMVMVFGAFTLGKELSHFMNNSGSFESLKNQISSFNQKLKNTIFLLSIILVTSTVATILLFQLPIPLIKDDVLRELYQSESFAYGISWGVIFSLTLLFLCLYPYYKLHNTVLLHIKQNRVKNDPELEKWLIKNENTYSFASNVKLLISIVSPSIAGILTSLISKAI